MPPSAKRAFPHPTSVHPVSIFPKRCHRKRKILGGAETHCSLTSEWLFWVQGVRSWRASDWLLQPAWPRAPGNSELRGSGVTFEGHTISGRNDCKSIMRGLWCGLSGSISDCGCGMMLTIPPQEGIMGLYYQQGQCTYVISQVKGPVLFFPR